MRKSKSFFFFAIIAGMVLVVPEDLRSSEILSKFLYVTTSANPESNQNRSFVIVDSEEFLYEGIKQGVVRSPLGRQIPFVVEYSKELRDEMSTQWVIRVRNKRHGKVKLLSKFNGAARVQKRSYIWASEILDESVGDRHRLVFRPEPFRHQPTKYKKGKGKTGRRTQYGGGTRKINRYKYNPQYAYEVTLHLYKKNRRIFTYRTEIKMDRKDMIRQEYINHYNIQHYRDRDIGELPIPRRDEITSLSTASIGMEGNPLTESKYKLIIDDGMSELAENINRYYTRYLREVRARGGLVDLNKKRRKIASNKLWISSGWRNPERNEWYSNEVNGNHQTGSAIDITIMAPASSTDAALSYWVLWKTLKRYRKKLGGSWQLESKGVPFKRKEYWQDIEPRNGIPDAFDKADHLHANVGS